MGQGFCRPGWDLHHHDLPAIHHAIHSEHNIPYHGPIAIPVVLPSGHLADTPEVAVAKSHHLAAVAQAKADKYYSGHSEYGYGGAYGYSGSHHGYGIPVVLPNGHIADTHEVAAAKSAHLLAVAKARADKYAGYGAGYGYDSHEFSGSYHGYGVPHVKADGHIADTHEVAAAKAAHMAAVAHAKAEHAQQWAHHQYDHADHHTYELEDHHEYELADHHDEHEHYEQPEIVLGHLSHYHHEEGHQPLFQPLYASHGHNQWY